jgi:hypothetical protein
MEIYLCMEVSKYFNVENNKNSSLKRSGGLLIKNSRK